MHERGRAFGIAIAAVYLGLSMGPTFCGLITTHFGWRFVFFIGVPACLASIGVSLSAVDRKIQKGPASQFDWQGTLLSAAGIGLFVTGGTFFALPLGKIALAMHMILAIFTFLCLLATFVSVKSIDSPHSLTNSTKETKP